MYKVIYIQKYIYQTLYSIYRSMLEAPQNIVGVTTEMYFTTHCVQTLFLLTMLLIYSIIQSKQQLLSKILSKVRCL